MRRPRPQGKVEASQRACTSGLRAALARCHARPCPAGFPRPRRRPGWNAKRRPTRRRLAQQGRRGWRTIRVIRRSSPSGNQPICSIITWKSHLSPRRITLRPRWHPPSPVKGPSIGNPPTFIGGARCTFVTWPNTEQDRSQCSSKDPAGKPLAGSSPDDHRPAGKRSTSAGRLRGRLLFYTVLKLPASDWTKR